MDHRAEKELASHWGEAISADKHTSTSTCTVAAEEVAPSRPSPTTDASAAAAAAETTPSWFDLGGLATSLAQSARQYIPPAIEGVASAIHQSALNVAAELAEMERMEASDPYGNNTVSDKGSGQPLPWQVEVNGTGNSNSITSKTTCTGPGDGKDACAAKDDEELKKKILSLSQDKATFLGPYNESNYNRDGSIQGTEQYLHDQCRVALIKRLLVLDPNLARMHAKLQTSWSSEMSETYFWKNYFYQCDRIRADHLVHDDELDAEVVLQTPPPSPASNQKQRISAASPPKVLSVDDLVIVDVEGEDGENDFDEKLAVDICEDRNKYAK